MSDSIDELRAANTRKDRNAMLSASDWTHTITDKPVENKDEWALYRKKLRDLPLREDFPDIGIDNFPQPPDSERTEYAKWLYVESPAEGESVWQVNSDWSE